MRKRLLVLAAGVVALTTIPCWWAATATEIPPSPLPVVDPATVVGLVPDAPVGADTLGAGAQTVCETVVAIIGTFRTNVCDNARPTNRCFNHTIQANFGTSGTTVSWHPVLMSECYVRNDGSTVQVNYHFTVRNESGVLMEIYGNRQVGPITKSFILESGSYDCTRTVGHFDTLTFTWDANGGGVSASDNIGESVACN